MKIKTIDVKDIRIGSILGKGTTAEVREILSIRGEFDMPSTPRVPSITKPVDVIYIDKKRVFKLPYRHNESGSTNESFLEKFEAGVLQKAYAIKRPRSDLHGIDRSEEILHIATEAEYLAVLSHENIVSFRGTCGDPGSYDYGIVLEKLYLTLKSKCSAWKAGQKALRKGCFLPIACNHKSELKSLLEERIHTACDLASAFEYLHDQNIVHRDLKPENVGFNSHGTTKLIDFGLAKELKSIHYLGADQYRQMTGRTGTKRYMAPEVFHCLPYGLSADVFAFAILLWEILSLEQPFAKLDVETHTQHVYVRKKRLNIVSSWSSTMKTLLRKCWSHSPSKRPTFKVIHNVLCSECKILK